MLHEDELGVRPAFGGVLHGMLVSNCKLPQELTDDHAPPGPGFVLSLGSDTSMHDIKNGIPKKMRRNPAAEGLRSRTLPSPEQVQCRKITVIVPSTKVSQPELRRFPLATSEKRLRRKTNRQHTCNLQSSL
ncbi:50S ribosomal protein L4, putative [Babesia ovata]|uniref:50S ribosomal protein L4, putative n=1 Tax=Babesia ovata TaxID=189622 RepID=A0A2H6KAB1_9APIC|nr:50S ribosomal protein L4, putative [Babesia ovata]GBE59937.1 50S ribosomal protein L4, putative [Babesia ovata]